MNTNAGSWKPSSPLMAAAESEEAAAGGGVPPQTPAAAGNALLQSVLAQQGSTPYWSPSTHAGAGGAAGDAGSGSPGGGQGLGPAAQEFVPGGAGAMEFVPGVGVGGTVDMGTQQAKSNDNAGSHVGAGAQVQGMNAGTAVDPRLYDQMIMEQGGSTYSEEDLIKPTPRRRSLGSFFMSDRLLERCQHLNECMLRQLEPGDERMKLIPSGYTSIFPLDAPGQDDSSAAGSFGYP